ncbi:transcription-repair coupling factor [Petroclostridium sp. X23]|uniref:transcription-repair coupling factor n=1 Tax=Petroclostridium sp. X23 TaxID=3045146 RepID=UPI0024AD2503|nr:transcription-repair coupling factor [Petroclostridium sp. X23]WHH57606.1 transcription-repair coupling factor [Petroclostridium sp. X23]
MRGFEDILLELEEYKNLLSGVQEGYSPINVTGTSDSQKAHLIYSLYRHTGKSCLILTHGDLQAKKLYEDLSFFVGDRVKLLPAKEFIFYDIEASSTDILQNRLKVMDDLCFKHENLIVIVSVDAAQQYIMPAEVYIKSSIVLEVGMEYDQNKMVENLMTLGYERVDMAEGKGQFSIRGGIIDVYPLVSDDAYRIEFFGDEIDSIREFDVVSQLSVEKVNQISIAPAREVIFDNRQTSQVISKMKGVLEKLERKMAISSQKELIEPAVQHLKRDIEQVQQQRYFPSIDKYLPFVYEDKSTVLQYFNSNDLIFIDEPSRVRQKADTSAFEYNETAKTMMEKGLLLEQTYDLRLDYSELISRITAGAAVGLSALSHSSPDYRPKRMINMVTKTLHSFHGKIDFLYDDLKEWKQKKYRIIVLSGTKNRGEQLVKTLNDMGLNSVYMHQIEELMPKGQITVTHGSLNKGFEYPLINFVIISDKEIFRQERKVSKSKLRKSANRIKAFTDLNKGDYIVHQSHGIGQYVGIEKLMVEGAAKDYLKIKYNGEDFLYVPASQLDLIQKYIGADGKAPRLNKLGGSDWIKTKNKVKKSVQELAKGLLELYAQRQAVTGYAFSSDTTWQRQFEDTFPYEETTDQMRCIEEVKEDMEKSKPMERLLCGDVGYGKTEVAIRAAFKAVMDGKQVAYLVPTTVLAQQHYNNFMQRMKDFPVKVEMLSRFKSAGEQKHIVKQLKTGEVDIIIGTHRILQKDLQFRSLGLLIIDEEQRFGVTHKEKLKSIKKDVDVLTLTATPIPRTLHMSMIGVRDMSVIEEPPEDRYPVQTYVLEYNYALIQDAIIREINRGGQVYYLFNRVKGIHRVAEEIRQMVPEARVAVAHGQMSEHELEEAMLKVLNGEIDVLVCTTIIETGLDIPNMNTIIMEDADRMGLSQLYQLRGRVGRSNRLAYAYLTYRKDKVLQEAAEKRLQAIKEFTEFGSGFKIAMRDLEIRGAGNLLGPEQHGHMEAVGYDMYCKLLEQVVKELKGEPVAEKTEASIDINVDAYIPENYIKNHSQRLEIYKKISSIADLQDSYDVEEEIEDRYGDLPAEVSNLIKIALLKNLSSELNISSISQKGNNIIIQFLGNGGLNMESVFTVVSQHKKQMLFTASDKPYITYKTADVKSSKLLDNIKIILQHLKELQTS